MKHIFPFIVITLLQLCRAEIQNAIPEWYSANLINDAGFSPKPLTEIFSTDSTLTSKTPESVSQPITKSITTSSQFSPPYVTFPSTNLLDSTTGAPQNNVQKEFVSPTNYSEPQSPPIMSQVSQNNLSQSSASPTSSEFLLAIDQNGSTAPATSATQSTPTAQETSISFQTTISLPQSNQPIAINGPNNILFGPNGPQANPPYGFNGLGNLPFGSSGSGNPPFGFNGPANSPFGINGPQANSPISNNGFVGTTTTAAGSPPTNIPRNVQTGQTANTIIQPFSPTYVPQNLNNPLIPTIPNTMQSLGPINTMPVPNFGNQNQMLRIRVKSPKGSRMNLQINPSSTTRRPTTTRRITTTRRRNGTRRNNNYELCVEACRANKTPICASQVRIVPINPDSLKGFASPCHMTCHNNFRKDQYEKIADGRCGKLRTRIRPVDKDKLNRDDLNKAQYTILHNGPETVIEFAQLTPST